MYFKYVIVFLFSVDCCAADTIRNRNDGDGGNPYIAALAIGMGLGGDLVIQRDICTRVSQNTIVDLHGNEWRTFAYSPSQRLGARNRQEAIKLGFFNLVACKLFPQLLLGFRHTVSASSLVESALLPVAIYAPIKETVASAFPRTPQTVQSLIAAASTYLLAHVVIASGASPERIIINSLLSHILAHQHNLWRDIAYIKQITGSLSYASKVMPFTQMVLSKWYSKPSMLTIHPVLGEMSMRAEFMHGVIPALVLAGVDFGFNAVAATPVGTTIESLVDVGLGKVVKPLPVHMQKPFKNILKKSSAEAAKIGTALAIIAVMEANGFKVS